MDAADYFSESYAASRTRFREAAARAGFVLPPPQPLDPEAAPETADLTVDAAVFGPEDAAETLIFSSGLHGVEGYFGAAAQLGVLGAVADGAAIGPRRIVLVHALNPFGFAQDRRWNENGVDLNRNFLKAGEIGADPAALEPEERYEGCSEAYRQLNDLLNPASPPPRGDLFYMRAIPPLLRHGYVALKNALSTGQYEYPKGLWFGGKGPERLMTMLQEPMRGGSDAGDGPPLLDVWLGTSPRVRWYDLHTGLGRSGEGRLFVNPGLDAERLAALERLHGPERVVSVFDGVDAMPNRGLMRKWIAGRDRERDVVAMTAEFGTYPTLRVLKAMRAEQRAWSHGARAGKDAWTAHALREVFAPADRGWRRKAVEGALAVFRQAIA